MTLVDDIISEIERQPIDTDALEAKFEQAPVDRRVEAIRQFNPDHQRRLFAACAGRSVALVDIVPQNIQPLTEVIHEGQNTLPMFRAFQKRFCRPSDEHQPDNRQVLWGYNHQTFSGITGPGYFVAYDDSDTGELVIDYRELPPERPEHWPPIIENKAKLGRFVYAGMVDRLRRVADGVTIGRAYKSEPMNAFFALVRTGG